METLRNLFYNYVLTASLFSWLAAQILKTVIYLVIHHQFRVERMVGAGGMPSAHSALVCALAIAVSRVCGVGSPEFAISLLFAIVVMYDATGVRRAAGEQAKRLNKLISNIRESGLLEEQNGSSALNSGHPEVPGVLEDEDDFFGEHPSDELGDKELKEFLGHTPLEVLAGALLGILIATLMPV